jgi:hypothetical protein
MVDNIYYLPGSPAVLIYTGKDGCSHSSIVEIIREHEVLGQIWYAIKASCFVLNVIGHVAPLVEFSNTNIEEGQSIGLVHRYQLKPVGTRTFRIVQ